jgi:hypothetical protein
MQISLLMRQAKCQCYIACGTSSRKEEKGASRFKHSSNSEVRLRHTDTRKFVRELQYPIRLSIQVY